MLSKKERAELKRELRPVELAYRSAYRKGFIGLPLARHLEEDQMLLEAWRAGLDDRIRMGLPVGPRCWARACAPPPEPELEEPF